MEHTIFITCPLEPEGCDKVQSFELNRSTGEYYCHNCHEYGNIRDWNNDEEE